MTLHSRDMAKYMFDEVEAGVRTLISGDLEKRSWNKMLNTKVVGITILYILIPLPTLYDAPFKKRVFDLLVTMTLTFDLKF